MKQYKLTATLGGQVSRATIRANNDGDAMMQSIGIVMNKAFNDGHLWSRGKIELRDQDGTLINEMAEKEAV